MGAGTHALFPTNISPAEADAGFQLVRIDNPIRGMLPGFEEMYVAVCPVGRHARVVKVRTPGGQIGYVHRFRAPATPGGSIDDAPWTDTAFVYADIPAALAAAQGTPQVPQSPQAPAVEAR